MKQGGMKETYFKRISDLITGQMAEDSLVQDSEGMKTIEGDGSEDRVKTGLDSLDKFLYGFRNGHLYTIAGRPGIGTTTLLLQTALNIASARTKAVYIVSLEMLAEHIVPRMISIIADIDLQSVMSGDLTIEQQESKRSCLAAMSTMPIYIIDSIESVEEIETLSRNEIKDGILLIDYFQLIGSNSELNDKDNHSRMPVILRQNKVAASLKQLAEELRIPIIVSVQLSRSIELFVRKDKRPQLDDLLEQGDLLQYSDGVVFIYRDSYYTPCADDHAELILAKNRSGEIGTAFVRFDRDKLLFETICD